MPVPLLGGEAFLGLSLHRAWSECFVHILPPGLVAALWVGPHFTDGKLRQAEVQGLCSQTAELACAAGPFVVLWEMMLVASAGGAGGVGGRKW